MKIKILFRELSFVVHFTIENMEWSRIFICLHLNCKTPLLLISLIERNVSLDEKKSIKRSPQV